MPRSEKDIIESALIRELEVAKKNLQSTFYGVNKMVEYNGGRNKRQYEDPRSAVDLAIKKLEDAAEDYDRVKETLENV